MGEVVHKSSKPLQVNPFKLSQPMGATLAFLGVDKCMPLMHGGQGCTSFTKVFFTRHFCEPIAVQTSAVTDAIAVLDGGDYSIVESVKNITRKVTPSLIGLHTTGLPETKGDDVAGVARQIDFRLAAKTKIPQVVIISFPLQCPANLVRTDVGAELDDFGWC
jgi:nitrogenase molybdenum-iron protein NifN